MDSNTKADDDGASKDELAVVVVVVVETVDAMVPKA